MCLNIIKSYFVLGQVHPPRPEKAHLCLQANEVDHGHHADLRQNVETITLIVEPNNPIEKVKAKIEVPIPT